MRFLYTLVVYLFVPLALLRLWWRGRQNPAYRQRWKERFGYVTPLSTRPVWVHAVSVGESIAAIPLIKKLIAEKYPVVVTSMTITGGERIQATFGSQVTHYYIPYDVPGAVKRFFKRVNPRLGIIMETEIWPNLYARAARIKLPLLLVNARLSPDSFKHYGYFLSLFTPALNCLTHIDAQTQMDADRYKALGADPSCVSVMGNIKFDIEVPEKAYIDGKQLREAMSDRPVWIAASTHAGEEEMVLESFAQIREKIPNALLVLVPRHPERFDSVAELIQNRGFSVCRRSAKESAPLATVDVFLGDTMGELLSFYAASDVAFVGGSFMPIGGHNVLEPAALSVPSITGPHTFNFVEIMQLMLNAGGCIQLSGPELLADTVSDLLSDPIKRKKMGEAAYQTVVSNRGAFGRLWERVLQFLK
jgi:3-deoxy-D-manno-octulosonic-acid transferase